MPKSTNTRKLGPITETRWKDHFKMRMRWPGWYPDADDDDPSKPPDQRKRKEIFLEEVVGLAGFKFIPFGPPKPASGDYFEEPTQADEVVDFNRWILGHGVPKEDETTDTGFTVLIRELLQLFRCYNASLYRLRRLRFAIDHPNDALPRHNPHGDVQRLPAPESPAFKALCVAAEANWNLVVDQLNHALTERVFVYVSRRPQDRGDVWSLKIMYVDVAEINNYVVSVRVVVQNAQEALAGDAKTAGRRGAMQPGGSSSHVSISSAFSSS